MSALQDPAAPERSGVASADNHQSHDEQNRELLYKILLYLNTSELKNARLVNSSFNETIMSNHDLFWGKNSMIVHFPRDNDDANRWVNLRLHRLILQYHCPNFHFVHTNLLSDGAIEFFQSSLRHQIKHLKITKCRLTLNVIIYMMACCSSSLEHLEIVDFSRIERSPGIYQDIYPDIKTSLQNLRTLILDNKFGPETSYNLMSYSFLYNILRGARQLSKIRFVGWGAKSCENLIQIFRQLAHENLQGLESLELTCKVEDHLTPLKQFAFALGLESLAFPNLEKFALRFNQRVGPSEGLTENLIEEITECIATFIEGSSSSLQDIEFINCPLTNEVFRKGIECFPSLIRLTTTGSQISHMDEDGNPIEEIMCRKRKKCAKGRKKEKIRVYSGLSTSTKSPAAGSSSQAYFQKDIYYLCCMLVFIVGIVHFSLRYFFPSRISEHLEIFIHALATLTILSKKEIQDMCRQLSGDRISDE